MTINLKTIKLWQTQTFGNKKHLDRGIRRKKQSSSIAVMKPLSHNSKETDFIQKSLKRNACAKFALKL